jgi:hypothetical protein
METLLLLAVIVGGGFTVIRTVIRMHSPFEMDYAEGTILNSAWRYAQGVALYPPLRGLPYEIDPYPPFIYTLVGAVIKNTGLSFFYPRLLALTAAIVACLLASILIHHWTQRWRLAVAFGLLPLTIAAVQPWLGIIRYDLIGIALGLAGLVIFVVFPRYRFWSLPFFALSVAGLYTLVAAPAACCLYLWTRSEKLKGVLFGACLTAFLIAGFLYGQHVTAGSMGYHLFKTQHSPYSVSQLASLVQGFLRSYSLLFLLSAAVIWKGIKEKQLSFIILYWVLVAGTALSLGKIGAAQNHVLQLIFASCIAAAVGYEWMRRNSSSDYGLTVVLATLTILTIANTPFHPGKPIDSLVECPQAYAAVRNDLGDRILSDNVGALVLAGKQVYVSDPFVYGWLVRGTKFPDNDMLKMIANGEFTSIVLNHGVEGAETDDDRFQDGVRQEILKNYQLTGKYTCNDANFVYQPKYQSKKLPASGE